MPGTQISELGEVSLEVHDGVHGEHEHVGLRAAIEGAIEGAIEARTGLGVPIRDLGPDYHLRREPVLPAERSRVIASRNAGARPPTVRVIIDLRAKCKVVHLVWRVVDVSQKAVRVASARERIRISAESLIWRVEGNVLRREGRASTRKDRLGVGVPEIGNSIF